MLMYFLGMFSDCYEHVFCSIDLMNLQSYDLKKILAKDSLMP